MFFPRLRRRAKWVFALLAVVFALAFVVAGVGSGFGSGLGDYLADIFNRQPTGESDAVEARKRAIENPQDEKAVEAYRDSILQDTSLTTGQQVAELNRYLKLRPRDADALQQLAGLYLTQAGVAEQRAAFLFAEKERAEFGSTIQDPSSKLSEGLGSDPITEQIRNEASTNYATAIGEAQALYGKEAEVWQRVATIQPDEAAVFFELGRSSQQSGNTRAAISALERYLELAPEATDAQQIRQVVRELKQQQAAQPPSPVTP